MVGESAIFRNIACAIGLEVSEVSQSASIRFFGNHIMCYTTRTIKLSTTLEHIIWWRKHYTGFARMGDTVQQLLSEVRQAGIACASLTMLVYYLEPLRWASSFLVGAAAGCLNKAGGNYPNSILQRVQVPTYLRKRKVRRGSSRQGELTLASSSYMRVILSIEQTQQVVSTGLYYTLAHLWFTSAYLCWPASTFKHELGYGEYVWDDS